jgi:pyoverdine/dityrosine biosynthesis protein Dit1
MGFGKNAGMYTVFVATTNPELPFPHPDIDLRFGSLQDFVKALQDVTKFYNPFAVVCICIKL